MSSKQLEDVKRQLFESYGVRKGQEHKASQMFELALRFSDGSEESIESYFEDMITLLD